MTDTGVRYVRGGHWWESRDRDARTRAYGQHKWWDGYMHHRAIDLVTHAPLAVSVTPANVNEYDEFPNLYERVVQATGAEATAVIADLGFAVSKVYDFLVERGVTPVTGTRETSKGAVADGRTPSRDPRCDMQVSRHAHTAACRATSRDSRPPVARLASGSRARCQVPRDASASSPWSAPRPRGA